MQHKKKRKFIRFRYILLITAIVFAGVFAFRFIFAARFLKAGFKAAAANDIDTAIERLEDASSLNPWSPEALIALGSLYIEKGFYLRAAEVAEKASQLRPDSETAALLLGEASFHQARIEDGKKNFPEAFRLYRKSAAACKKALTVSHEPDTINYLGANFLYLGEYDEGIIFFGERVPDNPGALREKNNLMEIKKRFLSGAGPSQIIGADTSGPLPAGAEIAVENHLIFRFSGAETMAFQNGVFYSDLDSDNEAELILIYKTAQAPQGAKSCYVSVFKRIRNRWEIRWNTRLSGADIGFFTVDDINADSVPEIAVESIYDFRSGALLNIYCWNGSSYKTLQQVGPTWGSTLVDLDNDGNKEIVVLDRKKNEWGSVTYKWDGAKYSKLQDE